jgi:hypothetical protein
MLKTRSFYWRHSKFLEAYPTVLTVLDALSQDWEEGEPLFVLTSFGTP